MSICKSRLISILNLTMNSMLRNFMGKRQDSLKPNNGKEREDLQGQPSARLKNRRSLWWKSGQNILLLFQIQAKSRDKKWPILPKMTRVSFKLVRIHLLWLHLLVRVRYTLKQLVPRSKTRVIFIKITSQQDLWAKIWKSSLTRLAVPATNKLPSTKQSTFRPLKSYKKASRGSTWFRQT